MCYERMFFSLWRKSKAAEREEMTNPRDAEQVRARVQPIHAVGERKAVKKKSEHELEEIV
jgi:hypothetical protein